MKSPNHIPKFVDWSAGLFILLYLYAAIAKFKDFEAFVMEIDRSPLSGSFLSALALSVPGLEIVLCILLFIPHTRFAGLVGSTLVIGTFSFYIAYMLLFAPKLPCSCGGILQSLTWRQHLYLNLGFLALGTIAILLHPKTKNFVATNRRSRKPANRVGNQ